MGGSEKKLRVLASLDWKRKSACKIKFLFVLSLVVLPTKINSLQIMKNVFVLICKSVPKICSFCCVEVLKGLSISSRS
jgi:hypothetical protein